MEDYAYGTAHKEVIKKVKSEKWYKEELFARFIPIEINKIPESQA